MANRRIFYACQAVGIAPDAKANEIGTVLQKGYALNGRLLRPAMVMVGA